MNQRKKRKKKDKRGRRENDLEGEWENKRGREGETERERGCISRKEEDGGLEGRKDGKWVDFCVPTSFASTSTPEHTCSSTVHLVS